MRGRSESGSMLYGIIRVRIRMLVGLGERRKYK